MTARIGLNGPETEHIDAAAEARNDCNDVGRVHVGVVARVPTGSSVDDAPYRGVASTGPVTKAHHNQLFEFIVGPRGTHRLRRTADEPSGREKARPCWGLEVRGARAAPSGLPEVPEVKADIELIVEFGSWFLRCGAPNGVTG